MKHKKVKKYSKLLFVSVLSLLGYCFASIGIWGGSFMIGGLLFSSYGLLLLGGVIVGIGGTLLAILLHEYPSSYLQLFASLFLFVQLIAAYLVFGTTSQGFFIMVMILLLHLGLYTFFHTKRLYFKHRLHTTTWSISHHGMGALGSIIGAVLVVMMSMHLLNAEVECEAIYETVESLIYSPVQPVSNAASWALSLGEKPVDEVIDMEEKTYSGSLSVISVVDVAKAKVIDGIREDKEAVRSSICEIVAKNIETKIQRGLGIIPTIVLLFLIISPLVSLLFSLLSILIRLIVHIFLITRVFRWKKRVKHTKEIE